MTVFLVCLYFTWLAVQNFVLPLAYRHQLLSASSVAALMALKEAVLVVAIAILVPRAFGKDVRCNVPDRFAAAYITLLIFYLVFAPSLLGSAASFELRMISLRSVISLALFYIWGRLSWLGTRELRHLIQFVVGLQVVVAIFGLCEWLFLPASFWSDTVGIGVFMLDVKGLLEGQNVAGGLPSNMFQFGLRRAISTYGDPLALGLASVFPLLVCVALGLRRRAGPATPFISYWTAGGLIAAALLLTIGRESIGAAGLGIALLARWSGKFQRITLPILGLTVGLLFLPRVWTAVVSTITFHEGSAATHLEFLRSGWGQAPEMLLGKGLGEAGGWAFSLAGVQTEVGENSYFELMAQTGLLSAVLLGGFLLTTARAAFRYSRKIPDPLISVAFLSAAAHIVSRSVFAVFSPSLFGVVPLASFFFVCGVAFTTMQRLELKPQLQARRVLVLRPATQPGPESGIEIRRIGRRD